MPLKPYPKYPVLAILQTIQRYCHIGDGNSDCLSAETPNDIRAACRQKVAIHVSTRTIGLGVLQPFTLMQLLKIAVDRHDPFIILAPKKSSIYISILLYEIMKKNGDLFKISATARQNKRRGGKM